VTDTRPVLLGMNNPLSGAAHHALYPHPPGCTGHRIFEMLRERVPELTRRGYQDAFDRRNVLEGRQWSLAAAREAAQPLWSALERRTVVCLGLPVLSAWRLPAVPPLVWQYPQHDILSGMGPERWCLMPHPSGLNRWYNDPAHRLAAAMRLEQLYRESRGET